MYICGGKWITMGISLDSGDNSRFYPRVKRLDVKSRTLLNNFAESKIAARQHLTGCSIL